MVTAPRGRRARRAVRGALAALLVVSLGLVLSGGAAAAPKLTLDQVRRQVDTLREQAEGVTESYDASREQLAALNVRITATQSELGSQRRAVDDARARLGKIAVEVYKAGDLATAALLLGDQPDRFLMANGLLTSLADQRAQAVGDLARQRQALVGRVTDLSAQQQRIRATQAQMQTQQKDIEAKLALAEALLRRLSPAEQKALQQQTDQAEQAGLASVGVKLPPSGKLTCADLTISPLDARTSKVVKYACGQLGEPYLWGGSGPGSFDCSGLSMMAWKQVGVSLPHNAAMQATYGTRVALANARPGDLMFFYSPIGHDGIYLGQGLMLHAPRTGETIRIVPVKYMTAVTAVIRL